MLKSKQMSLRSAWTHWKTEAPDLPPIDELYAESHPACFSRADACHAARDWPLRSLKARAERSSCTLGDCIAASVQACLRHVPAHGFEIFRAAQSRPTVELAGLDLRLRVRACPSAYDVANGVIVYATMEEDAQGQLCLVLRRKATPVATLALCNLEVVRIGERMVALVPLLVGRASRSDIESCIENMGILSLQDDAVMGKFLALLVAGGLTPHTCQIREATLAA